MSFAAFVKAEKQGWHDRADAYHAHTALATIQIIPAMLDALKLRPSEKLLDVARGPGYVAGAAAALDVHAEGVDYAAGMVAAAKKRFPGLEFSVADAEDLPMKDNSFDAVSCNMGLFHMGDPARAMAEAARVLRPGGRFSFSQWVAPNTSPLYAKLLRVLKENADLNLADPAPDAYALSDVDTVTAMMTKAGFAEIDVRELDTSLIAYGNDFFEFFMKFGVRVPLIVEAQSSEVKGLVRMRINEAMQEYKTS